MVVAIPISHRNLLTEKVHAVLTTLMPDGMPQSSIVWIDYDGENVLVNTTLERQKGRNMLRNPKVTMLVIDPNNTSRWIEIRGKAIQFDRSHAEAHADKQTRRYTGKKHFYGDIYPIDQKNRETRVVVKIEPIKISVDAVFT